MAAAPGTLPALGIHTTRSQRFLRRITMRDSVGLVASVLTGVACGTVFFEGLWWTTHRLLTARAPWLLLTVSFGFRAAIVIAGLVMVSAGHWKRLLAAVAGLLLARAAVLRRHRLQPGGDAGRLRWS